MQTLHLLTRVPDHIIDAPARISGQQRWQRRYNIAGWVRFDSPDDSPVRLILRYRDATGKKDISIDQSKINSRTLLLSGIANLKPSGPIERMELLLQCGEAHFVVDELFVQPVRDKSARQPRVQWSQ